MPENDDEDNPPSMDEQDSVPPIARLGRAKRVQLPRQMLIPTTKGKHHDEGVYEGVGLPQIKIIRVECKMDRIKNHFAGSGYSNKWGVINLKVDDDTPALPKMTESHTDAHILGVILVKQYGLKKGIELFEEKADATVVKELTQIHELETYKPIMDSDLS